MSSRIDRDLLKKIIRENIETLCLHFFPNGKKAGSEWQTGNLQGEPGRTLNICLNGDNPGIFQDFATGEHGDFIMAVKLARGLSFVDAAREIGNAVGVSVDIGAGASNSHGSAGSTKRTGPRYTTAKSSKPCNWEKDYQLAQADLDELVAWRGLSASFCGAG